MSKHNDQPVISASGVDRFQANPIVAYLLDVGPFDMHHLALVPGFTDEDYAHFAQLIGYSVSGYMELSYVSDDAWEKACEAQGKLHADDAQDPT